MKTAIVNINIRVHFEYNESELSYVDACYKALDLAVRPLYNEDADEDVHLTDMELNGMDYEKQSE